jgi:hypothetical protein
VIIVYCSEGDFIFLLIQRVCRPVARDGMEETPCDEKKVVKED